MVLKVLRSKNRHGIEHNGKDTRIKKVCQTAFMLIAILTHPSFLVLANYLSPSSREITISNEE